MNEDAEASPRLVRDLMTVGVPTCPLHTAAADLTGLMLEKQFEGVIVLDELGHAAGVVTWDELVAAYADEGYQQATAADIMRADVPQVPPDIPLTAAAQIMRDWGVRILFMMHHAGGINYPAAMLSYRHLLRHIAGKEPEDLRDLGIRAARKTPVEMFIERRDAARAAAKNSSR